MADPKISLVIVEQNHALSALKEVETYSDRVQSTVGQAVVAYEATVGWRQLACNKEVSYL